MAFLLLIPLLLVVAAVSFYIGVRYCTRSMLPAILARMTEKEIGELARKAAQERPQG